MLGFLNTSVLPLQVQNFDRGHCESRILCMCMYTFQVGGAEVGLVSSCRGDSQPPEKRNVNLGHPNKSTEEKQLVLFLPVMTNV